MKRRTKIVCTLGPAVATRERIKELIEAGMNVARINCSHGEWDVRADWVKWIRELSPKVGPVAILADLQGPKFRIGEVAAGVLNLTTGQSITVGQDSAAMIPIPSPVIFEALKPGVRLLLGDGNVELKIGEKSGQMFEAKALSGGAVKSRQGVTIVGKSFAVPALTEKDHQDAYEAAKLGVDFIAMSYVRGATDMRELRRLVDKFDKGICLVAKIETRDAVKALDEIIQVSDVIMVARGDLGLQVDIEEVPLMQKKIIAKCSEAGKPVITATQMLESMISSPRPTRAEATDVANAILDGTDAVMLSGETAAGAYPIEAVKTMARIAEAAEEVFDHENWLDLPDRRGFQLSTTEAVAYAAAKLAARLKAKAILTTTTSGQTARLVGKFRPKVPVLCASWDEQTFRQMALVWGVESIFVAPPETTDDIIARTIDAFLRVKRLKIGDQVVVTAGIPPGQPGHTNLILVETVK